MPPAHFALERHQQNAVSAIIIINVTAFKWYDISMTVVITPVPLVLSMHQRDHHQYG